MDIVAILNALGFTDVTVLNQSQGLARIMTSKGWTYERFKTEDDITTWAEAHKP